MPIIELIILIHKLSGIIAFFDCRWLAEIDDSNWWHVDDAWIVDQLMDIQGKTNDARGPHWEDQWWNGALSQVSDKFFKVPISVIVRSGAKKVSKFQRKFYCCCSI